MSNYWLSMDKDPFIMRYTSSAMSVERQDSVKVLR